MVELEIDFQDKPKAMRFKRHLEKTHPSTRGKIKVEGCNVMKRKRKKVNISSRKFINKMLKNTPDFRKSAARFGG